MKSSSPKVIQLPRPINEPGLPLYSAFEQRKTIREISAKPLSTQLLANLLWSACGVNRTSGPFGVPGRTAASASNSQEIDIYVAMNDGAYLYDAVKSQLIPITRIDLRAAAMTPGQQGVKPSAPVQLIYVVDIRRLTHTHGFDEPGLHEPEVQKSYYFVDTGLIAGNVHIFAATHGLAAWFHNCNRSGLAKSLNLRSEQRALFAQSVGYPEA